MNSKEFVNKLIVFSKEQINYYENKVVEDEKYPSLQQCHQEELKSTQEGFNHLLKIKQDLEILEIFKDNVMIDEDEKVITLFLKNKEVVNKIKEWLYE